jgi:hypothetical protein
LNYALASATFDGRVFRLRRYRLLYFKLCRLFALLLLFHALPEALHAQTSATDRCAALRSATFMQLTDAPTVIISATVVSPERDLPTYCKVEGFVAPQVGFELRLPLDSWNHRFLMQGCGFMCGYLNMAACEDGLIDDYAVVNTDMGHGGSLGNTIWARNQFDSKIDFGYRATHVVAIAAKAIIEEYYGSPPQFSYFRGCSTGGRQAMVEAQRFPHDFNGIIAGGPVLNETGDTVFHLLWNGRQSVDASGHQLIDADKIPLVHQAVLDACDAQDGVKDGVLSNPPACHWDPSELECHGAPSSNCLTPTEVDVIRKIYRGDEDAEGHKLYPGGMMRGSELEWVPLFIGLHNQLPQYMQQGMALVIRNVFLSEDPGPQLSLLTVDLDRLARQTELVEPLYDAQNPDLTNFRDAGGKLMVYHGWNDAEIPPEVSVDYFNKVAAIMGGQQKTQTFFRLFMIPGMAHCRRGPGADAIDYLSAMVAWVEHGHAPDSLLSYHMEKPQAYNGLPVLRFPLPASSYSWSRPVYAYPNYAVWSGNGDWKTASSWTTNTMK